MREIGPVQDWPPQAGYWQTKLVKRGVFVPVFIWYGPPIIDGEELDRSPRWCVEIDGFTDRWELNDDRERVCRVPLDPSSVWPLCARWPITEIEFEFLRGRKAWALENDQSHPASVPRETIKLLAMKPIF